MNLYWHRWRTSRGLSYYLSTEPWKGDETTRQLSGEVAGVFYMPGSKVWHYEIRQHGVMASTWGHTGSPARCRKLVEAYIDRKSIAAFDDDVVTSSPA